MQVRSEDSPEASLRPLLPVASSCDPAAVSPGVVCVEVSVAADLLLAGSDDGRMAVWNLADRQLVHLLLGHTGVSPEPSEPHPPSAR